MHNFTFDDWEVPGEIEVVPVIDMSGELLSRNLSGSTSIGDQIKTARALIQTIHSLAPSPGIVYVDKGSVGGRASRGIGEESLSKAVSRNITMILEDLLKDYDKTERPSYKEGERF